ncbi:MAG: type II toxin-antitoxin system PemK/MazF family toxin [Oscillospiraceae bacterium]|nr:type II toxin-antitoxin system PemK/MazF family toxin [Oscillospiraceae bacterium]
MVKQGQIIKIDFHPSVGHKQSGYRPAVVVSNDFGIARHNVVYICPITMTNKPYPTHIQLDERTATNGVVLCEHMKSVDLNGRPFKYIEDMPTDIFEKVVFAVSSLIRLPE